MNEIEPLIVLLWVVVFGPFAVDPGEKTSSALEHPETGIPWTEETCEAYEDEIWSQPIRHYEQSNIDSMFTECLILYPRPAPGRFTLKFQLGESDE